jgi:hypothetical protein
MNHLSGLITGQALDGGSCDKALSHEPGAYNEQVCSLAPAPRRPLASKWRV